MIPAPRRSVTRFFIPLIDVLTLLFCIFLLMPYVKPEEPGEKAPPPAAADVEGMQREMDQLRRDRDNLTRDRETALRQQVVCVLEIDAESGKLYERGPVRAEVGSQAAAFAWLERMRTLAAGHEVYVLMLYPSVLTGYPEERQVTAYERWFGNVPHGFDRPMSRRKD